MSLVSIGKPDVGLELCDHLGVGDGSDWVYADPDNGLHDALVTNRGWDTMIRPATALRFKDRIFGSGKEGGGRGGSLDQVRRAERGEGCGVVWCGVSPPAISDGVNVVRQIRAFVPLSNNMSSPHDFFFGFSPIYAPYIIYPVVFVRRSCSKSWGSGIKVS